MNILSYIFTFLVGLGAGFALKLVIDISRKNRVTMSGSPDSQGQVVQKDNVVKGHMAGRDVNNKQT
jgi:hypothetical protein